MNTNDSDIDNAEPGGKSAPAEPPEFGWYAFAFGPPFRLIGLLYRTYHANRGRVAEFVSKPQVSAGLKKAVVLTLFLWIAIWLLAPDENRSRLTEAIKQNFSSLGTPFDD